MTVQTCIKNNDLQGAIQILLDNKHDNALLLMSRYNALAQEERRGTISFSNASVERARIVQAVLSSAQDQGQSNAYSNTATVSASGDFNEAKLLEIITVNKRRRPEIAAKAQRILTDYREYKDTKQITPSYDPAGRRLRALQTEANDLLKSLADEKEASLEQIVDRIAKLLEPTIPGYPALKEAYDLASGRGFKSNWIEQQLAAMPDDSEVRISIAEKVEAFTANIHTH